ncbi:MAG TPA: hypothetical protein DEP87_03215 [Candidatus Pacebacteria bacterium]|nr:hypothetical protein [Candidatus Paceibacterota bacterium]
MLRQFKFFKISRWWRLSKQRLSNQVLGFLFGLGILSLGAILTPTKVMADDNFWFDLAATYTVSPKGDTFVEHNFAITNRKPTYFINKYSLTISSVNLTQVLVKVGNQTLTPQITVADHHTVIAFDFPEKIVGEAKKLQFVVSYHNPDIAQVSGKVMEVAVPPLAQADDFRQYTVMIKTPPGLGPPSRSLPVPTRHSLQDGLTTTTFETNASQGISSVYGSEQFYKLQLNFPLDNPGDQPIQTQITFPPDTPNQLVFYELIDPEPASWKVDDDGNWLATYVLPANGAMMVTAQVKVKLTLDPNSKIPPAPVLLSHTKTQEFWPSANTKIAAAAEKLAGPTEIYQFTTEALSYIPVISPDLKRLGALAALAQPDQATCQEYTDLFISLARAKNIPARRLVGFAQTQNQKLRPVGLTSELLKSDVLHAWPEFFDTTTNQWHAIDPTWGDTTGGIDYFHQLDLNHLVFAINGTSDVLPYPAGSYKLGDNPSKTIEVSFAESFPEISPQFNLNLAPQKLGPITIPGWYRLTISNQTGAAWYQPKLTTAAPLALQLETNLPDRFLPFQTFTTILSAYNTDSTSWFQQQSLDLKLEVEAQAMANFTATPFYVLPNQLKYLNFSIASQILAGSGIVLAIGAWSLFFLGRQRSHSLRRKS